MKKHLKQGMTGLAALAMAIAAPAMAQTAAPAPAPAAGPTSADILNDAASTGDVLS